MLNAQPVCPSEKSRRTVAEEYIVFEIVEHGLTTCSLRSNREPMASSHFKLGHDANALESRIRVVRAKSDGHREAGEQRLSSFLSLSLDKIGRIDQTATRLSN